jgi:NADH:ubiquinone oxidoreductase subunit E
MADAPRIQIPAELEQRMDAAVAHYPTEHRRSAAMPLLHLWQEHFGFISGEGIFWIAEKLGLQPINILEVVTFYPMFRQHPAGKKHIRICRTLSCAMAGGLESSARVMVRKCIIRSLLAPTELTASNLLSAWPAVTPRQCAWLAKNYTRR